MRRISKEQLVHTALMGLARRAGPGGKLPTVRHLCKILSTSPTTIDRVLRRMESDRVLNRIQGSGLYVAPQFNQRRIAVVFGPDITDSARYSQFWWLLHGAASRLAGIHGDELRTYFGCPNPGNEKLDPSSYSLSEDVAGHKLSGILTFGIGDRERIEWLKRSQAPLVAFSNPGYPDAVVDLDARKNIQEGLLALRKRGCRRIAIVWFGEREGLNPDADAFRESIRQAIREIPMDETTIDCWASGDLLAGMSWKSLEDASAHIIHRQLGKGKIDGILFNDDTMAHGGIIAMLEAGIMPGRDIQTASLTHTGSSLLRAFHKYLIRIEIDPNEIVEGMFSLLGMLIQGINLPSRLVIVRPTVHLPA